MLSRDFGILIQFSLAESSAELSFWVEPENRQTHFIASGAGKSAGFTKPVTSADLPSVFHMRTFNSSRYIRQTKGVYNLAVLLSALV